MTITVGRLTARDVTTLDYFEATPQPDPWVAEVETFLLGPAVRHQIRHGGSMWVISTGEAPIGLAASSPHPHFAAELLQAFMIDHRHRRQGLARSALEAVLVAVHRSSPHDNTMWLVHPNNHVMVKLSTSIDPLGGTPTEDGYLLFAHP